MEIFFTKHLDISKKRVYLCGVNVNNIIMAKNTISKSPGLVLHQDMLKALQHCPPDRFKEVVLALGRFANDLTEPKLQFQDSHAIFEAFRERVEYDRQSFLDFRQKQSERAKKRWEGENGNPTASHGNATASHGNPTASHGSATASHGSATASRGYAILNGIELNNNSLSHAREEEEGTSVITTAHLNNNPNSHLNNNPSTTITTEGGAEAHPTMEQVCEFAKTICCPDYLARKFYHHYEANGWVTDGENPRPFRWQPKLAEWKAKEDAEARERHADISSKKKINNINNVNDEFNGI